MPVLKDEQPLFAIMPLQDGTAAITIWLSDLSIEAMKRVAPPKVGTQSLDFDFRKMGLPIVLCLTHGGKDRSASEKMAEEIAKALGITIQDERRKDMSVQSEKNP